MASRRECAKEKLKCEKSKAALRENGGGKSEKVSRKARMRNSHLKIIEPEAKYSDKHAAD
jgi:hypothetical protein